MGSNCKGADSANCTNEDLEQLVKDALVDDTVSTEQLQVRVPMLSNQQLYLSDYGFATELSRMIPTCAEA